MNDKKSETKINYNALRIIWILIYLLYMFFYGFTSFKSLNQTLTDRTTYIVNLFNTLYNQNAIQMVSNPENFKRVLVSDIEGEILLQYGDLIPALTNLKYNTLFNDVLTDKIVLSDFYYDPFLDDVCFDMGIIEKNRVYIGTVDAQEFLKNNLENLKLNHFIIFDSKLNGYLYQNSKILPVHHFEKDKIKWINNSLFITDTKLYLSNRNNLNNYQFITYIPFMNEVLSLFIFSLIPFGLGLLLLIFVEHIEKKYTILKKNEINKQLLLIFKDNKVPDSLKKENEIFDSDLLRNFEEILSNSEKNKLDMKRYVDKLSSYSEQLLDMKNDVEYLEKYFYNLINQEKILFSDSLKILFRIIFETSQYKHSLLLKLNKEIIYKNINENNSNFSSKENTINFNILELGKHRIEYYVNSDLKASSDFSIIRKALFEILTRYLSLIYSVKKGLNPAELSLIKNFSFFSEMVNREIEKVKRYNEKGMLFYLDMLNYSLIKEKYGISIANIILKKISEIILSKIRTSDIVGIYREGTFLVYFYNLAPDDAKQKIEMICNNIYNDEKIKQIGINIELKSSIVSVDKNTQELDDLLLKCLKTNK